LVYRYIIKHYSTAAETEMTHYSVLHCIKRLRFKTHDYY